MAKFEKKAVCDNLSKFLAFSQLSSEETRTKINFVLDQLNASDNLEKFISDPSDISALVIKGCNIINGEFSNQHLVVKFFRIVDRILSKQETALEERTLNLLVEHVLTSAANCSTLDLYEHLKLLSSLLPGNGVKCKQNYDALLSEQGFLLKCAESRNYDVETRKMALNCISNVCKKDSNGSCIPEQYGLIALSTVLRIMQTPRSKDMTKDDHCKLIEVCLKAIQDILPCIKTKLRRHLGQLIFAIKNFMFYGFPDHETSSDFLSSSPRESSSDIESDDLSLLQVSLNPVKERAFPARAALKKKTRQKRRQKNADKNDALTVNVQANETHRNAELSWRLDNSMNSTLVNPAVSSSESDCSDAEYGHIRRLRSSSARVRGLSLTCLQAIIKNSEKKDLFGFWSCFFPDSDNSRSWSLFTIIQCDAVTKNRMAAISVVMDLLDGCKPFLSAADDSDYKQSSSRPFTSFSSRLGSMIHELHRLVDFIAGEKSDAVRCLLVKCLALLILNSPYHKLQNGMLTKIVTTIRPILKENDLAQKQSCFVCLSAVLTVDAPLEEVIRNMQKDDVGQIRGYTSGKPTVDVEILNETCKSTYNVSATRKRDSELLSKHVEMTQPCSENSLPWLLVECFVVLEDSFEERKIDDEESIISIRSEVLLLLTVFVRNYFMLLRSFIAPITMASRQCIQSSSSTLKVNAIKLLQEVARVMYKTLTTDGVGTMATEIFEFWSNLLEGELLEILQSQDPLEKKAKSAACDCLSDIGPTILEGIALDKRILIITILLGIVNDDDGYVRAASIRCLGVFVSYPLLRDDVVFVTDAASVALNGLNDSVLLVRMRAAWALANISDVLVVNRNSEDSTFVYGFSESLFFRLVDGSLKASEDSEKVRCNLVRTLGNLGRYFTVEHMKEKIMKEALEKMYTVLSKCISNAQMKTRWNACYAAGNLYSSTCLPNGQTAGSIQLLDSLLASISTCKNFKVRINAVNAIAVPKSRDCYGSEEQFQKVWCCLLESLSATETISDFSEFRYRDNLRHQICLTLCHITTLIETEDIEMTASALKSHEKNVIKHLTNHYRDQLLKSEEEGCSNEAMSCIVRNDCAFLVAYEHAMTFTSRAAVTVQNVYAEAKLSAERHFSGDER